MESPFSSYICRMCLFRRIIKSKLILFSIDYDLGIKTVSQLTNAKKTYFIIAFGVALILSIDTAAYYAKILPSVIVFLTIDVVYFLSAFWKLPIHIKPCNSVRVIRSPEYGDRFITITTVGASERTNFYPSVWLQKP